MHRPAPGAYRLLVEEKEFISANYVLEGGRTAVQPSRPIFAEIVDFDEALIGAG